MFRSLCLFRVTLLLVTTIVLLGPRITWAQIQFTNVTTAAGIDRSGATFGSSWGDFNSDGHPDLRVGNHSAGLPSLYLNNRDGTFTDIGPENPPAALGDPHGAAWADFDNDGDQDLIELHGGCCLNRLFVNVGGSFVESAFALGISGPTQRGRAPLWFDIDADGKLDLVLANANGFSGVSRPKVFRQTELGAFEDATTLFGLTAPTANFAHATDVTGDRRLDVLLGGPFVPWAIHDASTLPAQNIASAVGFPTVNAVADVATGDFDGDGVQDFLSARTGSAFDFVQVAPDTVQATIRAQSDEQAFEVETSGIVTIEVGPPTSFLPSMVSIGAGGATPTSVTFSLDPSDTSNWGIEPHSIPTSTDKMFVGFDPGTGRWTIALSSPGTRLVSYRVVSTTPITEAEIAWNSPPTPTAFSNLITFDAIAGYVDEYPTSFRSACWGATTADFDNDMDLDVYLQCTGPASNYPNILLENDGSGELIPIANAGGATGSTLGRGESVTVADYDLDGYLDLFLTNGLGSEPLADGPHELFRNLGGTNHWLEIDLEGTVSNRDGIGAVVIVEAGTIEQIREQNGGIHNTSQDFQRLHFGLAQNETIDSITIYWPSGIVQRLYHVSADQILQIVETAPPVPFMGHAASLLLVALVSFGSVAIVVSRRGAVR